MAKRNLDNFDLEAEIDHSEPHCMSPSFLPSFFKDSCIFVIVRLIDTFFFPSNFY